MRRLALFTAILGMAVFGCTRQRASGASSSGATPLVGSATSDPSGAAATPTGDSPPPGPWRDLVREQRWREAATQIDALSPEERARPELRYLRARVAMEVRDHAIALKLLEGLEKERALLSDSIAKMRAEAQLEVGPFDQAAAYFAAKSGVKQLTRAAAAYERAGKLDDARRTIDRALVSAKGGVNEAAGRAIRLRLAEGAGQREVALADARWIVKEAPEAASASVAEAAIARLDPGAKLTPEERMARAEKLAAANKGAEALRLFDEMPTGPAAPDELTVQRARGMTLYKLRKYAEAADVLSKVAAKGGVVDDAFHAARALSRAHRDDEAIKAYLKIAKESPKSALADDAVYLAARLAMLLGRNDEAAAGYANYLRTYRKGKFGSAAKYELAMVDLARKEFAKARQALGDLARAEDGKAESARLRELEGVAALGAGDDAGARAAFAEVIRAQPLSFPALAARARLVAMKAPLPGIIEPAEGASSAPLATKLPAQAELLHGLGLDDEAEDAVRPHEKELATAAAPRGTEALCTLYGRLDQATRRYRIGQDQVKVDALWREPSQATRWAWECLYPRPYGDAVRASETRESLPHGIVHAVMRQESSFDVDVVSPAHAVGLLQLLPTTASEIAKRSAVPFEDGALVRPLANIDLGARYLALLVRMWKGNFPLAIASYNAGPAAVSRWVEHGPQEVDVFVARIPYGETRHYVGRVMANWARYAYLDGGIDAVPALTLAVDTSVRADADAF